MVRKSLEQRKRKKYFMKKTYWLNYQEFSAQMPTTTAKKKNSDLEHIIFSIYQTKYLK